MLKLHFNANNYSGRILFNKLSSIIPFNTTSLFNLSMTPFTIVPLDHTETVSLVLTNIIMFNTTIQQVK